MNEEQRQLELKHLNTTVEKLKDAKKQLDEMMKQMGAENLGQLERMRRDIDTDPHDLLLFMEQMHNRNTAFNFKDKFKRLEELEALLKEPYFSRIDLKDLSGDFVREVYIGKFGYNDGKNSVVTDWRSKVASVFYRYRYPQPAVEYDTPSGVEKKDLLLKRTFEIENGELIKFYNNDIQLDENQIIQEKIESRSGGVLEDIVETIQESQLDIIESDPRQICIVQGCVGSGKSTVAIHKLSHIFFNHPNLIKPERSILIAKNQILVGYLSTLFPKLGIFNIGYGTVRDLIIRLIFEEKLEIAVDLDTNEDTSGFSVEDIFNLKHTLNRVHQDYEDKVNSIFTSEEFISFGGFVYDADSPIYDNLTEAIEEMEEEYSLQEDAAERTTNPTRRILHKENMKSLKKILKRLRRLRTEVKMKTLNKLVSEIIGKSKSKYGFLQIILYLLIFDSVIGFKNFRKFEYCVIDEGQDFSSLEYLLLGKLVQNGRFCILGDLNQSYERDGLSTWDTISEVVEEARNAVTFELDTNYRSTTQIIDLANTILAPYTSSYLPKSINRIGPNPEIVTYTSVEELFLNFEKKIKAEASDINKSIGIICMNSTYYEKARSVILKLGVSPEKFVELDSSKRIHYIPQGIYLANFENCKGLEFSKVYVLGLNLSQVSNFEQAKKSFVAVTRAMNELVILS